MTSTDVSMIKQNKCTSQLGCQPSSHWIICSLYVFTPHPTIFTILFKYSSNSHYSLEDEGQIKKMFCAFYHLINKLSLSLSLVPLSETFSQSCLQRRLRALDAGLETHLCHLLVVFRFFLFSSTFLPSLSPPTSL